MSRLPELLVDLERWGPQVAVGRAVVVRTFGSSPWPAGATLLATAEGAVAGTVSGGCVEADAAEQIASAIASGLTRLVRYGVADDAAWDVGLACGGTIELLVEPTLRPELVDAARARDGRAVRVGLPTEAWQPPLPATVLPPGAPGASRDAVVTVDGREHFVEAFDPRPRLVTFGAGEVTRHLARVARDLGWSVVVVDPRGRLLEAARFPAGVQLVCAWPDEADAVVRLGAADAVAVLTHDPKLDEPALQLALDRGCRYVGAIGSRRTQADRRARLAAMGVPADALSRLRGPIGLDLGGRTPGETALAIVAEIVAVSNGAGGVPLTKR